MNGWAAQQFGLPASWYVAVSEGGRVEFPVSGDATARAKANPPMTTVDAEP
jgi:hypothetical protein